MAGVGPRGAPNLTVEQNFFLSPMHFLNRRWLSRRSSAFSTSCAQTRCQFRHPSVKFPEQDDTGVLNRPHTCRKSSSWHSHDMDTALSRRQS